MIRLLSGRAGAGIKESRTESRLEIVYEPLQSRAGDDQITKVPMTFSSRQHCPINGLLKSFEQFGVNLGLERITRLLSQLNNPEKQFPVIHVAGTNGKGSVCAYLSSILTAAGYRVGRFTSPHLVDWTERICIDDQAIAPEKLLTVLETVQQAIAPGDETPTQFEVITAGAFLHFAQASVDIAVVEVGLGGRLDSTNVFDKPLVSVITSIGRDHWQRLGETLDLIATEKAGILKQDCPAVIGVVGDLAKPVIQAKVDALNCPVTWVKPAQVNSAGLANYQGFTYELPLLGEMQRQNSAIALAVIATLRLQGWAITEEAIRTGLGQTRWAGRIEWRQWKSEKLLIDGAHNGEAALALRSYVDSLPLPQPVTWIIGMLSTKDHQTILKILLRPGDRLLLVPVGGHSSAKPSELGMLAQLLCPHLEQCTIYDTLPEALDQAIANPHIRVLCGSLYLLGEFLDYEAKV